MDDSQKQQQQAQLVQDGEGLTQPGHNTPQYTPSVPVSAPTKEHAPAEGTVGEYMRPSHPEVHISPEVTEAGVEHAPNHEQPHLSLQDNRAGIEHAKEATPIQTHPTGAVQIPGATMTEAQAQKVVKTGKPTQAKTWYAVLLLKLTKMINVSMGG